MAVLQWRRSAAVSAAVCLSHPETECAETARAERTQRPGVDEFYLTAILFIIFDLEVAFLFPWAVALGDIGLFGFWSMMLFLSVLSIGFVYEWKKGALEWD